MRATTLFAAVAVNSLLACGSSDPTPSDTGAGNESPADPPAAAVKAEGDAAGEDRATPKVTPAESTAGPTRLRDITVEIPKTWNQQTPQSSMRMAQYELPGDDGGATMAVFRFPGGAGSAAANLARWKGQLEPHPDSRPAKEQVQSFGPITVTSLDALGKFAPGGMPGAPSAAPIERARMLAAVVEGVKMRSLVRTPTSHASLSSRLTPSAS